MRWLGMSVVAVGLVGTASSVDAAPILDQSNLGAISAGGGFGHGVPGSPIVAQTFTVGIAGQLSLVSIAVSDQGAQGGSILAELRTTTAAGVPTGTVLASVSLTPAQVPNTLPATAGASDLTAIDVSAFNIEVNAGDVLAIVLSDPNQFAPYFAGWAGAMNSYSGGALYFNVSGGFSTLDNNFDLYFQTFMEPLAIAEPATLVLGLVGFAGLGLIRRAGKLDATQGEAAGTGACGRVHPRVPRRMEPTDAGE